MIVPFGLLFCLGASREAFGGQSPWPYISAYCTSWNPQPTAPWGTEELPERALERPDRGGMVGRTCQLESDCLGWHLPVQELER